MFQHLLVIAIFLAALFYVGRMLVRSFRTKSGCASGCGKCGVDFSAVEKKISKELRG
jgi:uncharacterized membrane protein